MSVTPLPPWFFTVTNTEGLDKNYATLELKSALAATGTPFQGTLFMSAHVCLRQLMVNPYTPSELRHHVALSVMDVKNEFATKTLEQYRSLLLAARREQDVATIAEYSMAQPLLDDAPPFSPETRRRVFSALMDGRIYMGDHFGVLALQHLLRVHIWVIHEAGSIWCTAGTGNVKEDTKAWHFVLMRYTSGAYAPVIQMQGEDSCFSAFKMAELPPFCLAVLQGSRKSSSASTSSSSSMSSTSSLYKQHKERLGHEVGPHETHDPDTAKPKSNARSHSRSRSHSHTHSRSKSKSVLPSNQIPAKTPTSPSTSESEASPESDPHDAKEYSRSVPETHMQRKKHSSSSNHHPNSHAHAHSHSHQQRQSRGHGENHRHRSRKHNQQQSQSSSHFSDTPSGSNSLSTEQTSRSPSPPQQQHRTRSSKSADRHL